MDDRTWRKYVHRINASKQREAQAALATIARLEARLDKMERERRAVLKKIATQRRRIKRAFEGLVLIRADEQ